MSTARVTTIPDLTPHGAAIGAGFGLRVRSAIALPGLGTRAPSGAPDVTVRRGSPHAVHAAWSGESDGRVATVVQDGQPFTVRRGRAGDLLLEHGDDACFHVSREHDTILCAPSDPEDIRWKRVLMDTVLWLTALWHGREALHAGAVATGEGVVAIVAGSGGGKSTLTSELLARGATHFTDDVLCFDDDGLVHPGPALMTLPERRPAMGRILGHVGGERWEEILRGDVATDRLAALVILRRCTGSRTRMVRLTPRAPDLLPRLLSHPFADGREAARLSLCARIARQVPVMRLEAGMGETPKRLAELVEKAVGGVARA